MSFSIARGLRATGVIAALIAFFAGTNVGAATGELSGIDKNNLDPTCKACDDFYQFANGGWITSHPVPASSASTGNFNLLADRNQEVLHGILEEASRRDVARNRKRPAEDRRLLRELHGYGRNRCGRRETDR